MFKRESIRPAARSLQSGMTLVEIMVAMTIGIILLLALGSLFVNSTRVFKVNDEFSRMQENGAYALNTMGNDLRMAGFYGHIATNDLAIPVAITITNDCGANWATTFTQSLGTGTLAKMSSCIKAANFLSGSFILVLRGATGIEVQPADLNAGTLYVQSDPGGGILFQGDQYAAGLPASSKRAFLGGAAAPIYPYQARAYYLRPCSRPTGTGGTVCLATDDNNQPIPTLVRQELAGTTMTEVAIAEGIEAVRILYGLGTGGTGAPVTYTETPTAEQFAERVVTARISLLVRSPRPSNDYDDRSRSYDLDGDGTAELNCLEDGLPCNYHRHVFTQSFQVRNIAQRLESSPP